jgi:hypothetical protein
VVGGENSGTRESESMYAFSDETTCARCDAERCPFSLSYKLSYKGRTSYFCSLKCLARWIDAAIGLQAE